MIPNISELKKAIKILDGLRKYGLVNGYLTKDGIEAVTIALSLIDQALSQQAEQETLSEEQVYQILYDVLGVAYLKSSEDKIDQVHADVMENSLKVAAKALLGKIPCNGSGRIGERKTCPICGTKMIGESKVVVSPNFTDREARYRELLQLILPMAKGYAYKNDVGSNMEYIRQAETALNEGKEV